MLFVEEEMKVRKEVRSMEKKIGKKKKKKE